METRVSEITKVIIDEIANNLKQKNLLFVKAANGEISSYHIGLYLHNLYIILSKTAEHIRAAKKSAQSKKLTEIATFFQDRFDLESGNQHWIGLDLSEFNFTPEVLKSFYLTPSMLKLINYVESLAVNNPEAYLTYELFTGSLILNVGPTLLEQLHMNCGVSTKQLQVIERFQRMNNEYDLVNLDVLDNLIKPKSFSNIEKAMRTANKLFQDFLIEVASSDQAEISDPIH